MIIIREYEGPFGDWHGERLCKPKEFLKQVICIERMDVCRYDMIDMTWYDWHDMLCTQNVCIYQEAVGPLCKNITIYIYESRWKHDTYHNTQGQQNYQSYQGMWVGKFLAFTSNFSRLTFPPQMTRGVTEWASSVTMAQTWTPGPTPTGSMTMSGPASCPARVWDNVITI